MIEQSSALATPVASSSRRRITGKVVSEKMAKTVVVECVSRYRDALYGKYVSRRRKFKAHDEMGRCALGDVVEIEEHAPISRHKRFIVVRVISKHAQE